MKNDDTWYDGLTERQRRFCEAFTGNGGNALKAAESAGYSNPHPEGSRLMQRVSIKAALEKLRTATTSTAIASREERLGFWSSVMRDDSAEMKDRLKASEILGRCQGDFVVQAEIIGLPAQQATRIEFVVVDAKSAEKRIN